MFHVLWVAGVELNARGIDHDPSTHRTRFRGTAYATVNDSDCQDSGHTGRTVYAGPNGNQYHKSDKAVVRRKDREPHWREAAEYPIRLRLFHIAAQRYVDFKQSLATSPVNTSHYDDEHKRPLNRFLVVEFCTDFEHACRDAIGDNDHLWDALKTYLLQLAELTEEKVPEKTKQQIVLRVGRLLMQRRIDERYFVKIRRKLPA